MFGLSSIGNGKASPLSLRSPVPPSRRLFLQAMTNAVVILDQTTLDGYQPLWSWLGRGPSASTSSGRCCRSDRRLVIAIASTPSLNVISLGEDVARSLGTNIAMSRTIGIVAITLLTGAATAACGPIAFIGLVVPHVARAITGPDYPLAGAVRRTARRLDAGDVRRHRAASWSVPGELQVGIVLAVVGAPFFIALVRRRKLATCERVLNSLPQPTAGDSAKVPSRPALRIGPLSLVLRPFMIVVNVALLVLLFLLVCIGIGRGDFRAVDRGGHQRPLRRRLQGAAVHRHGSAPPASVGRGPDRHRARHLRTITQSIARNALASPDILGITSGASAAAVALIVLGGGARSWVCSRHSASRWRHWPVAC